MAGKQQGHQCQRRQQRERQSLLRKRCFGEGSYKEVVEQNTTGETDGEKEAVREEDVGQRVGWRCGDEGIEACLCGLWPGEAIDEDFHRAKGCGQVEGHAGFKVEVKQKESKNRE